MSTTTESPSPGSAPNSETASTAALNGQYQNREIDLALIDPPENPERETMDEQELGELAASIREVGLIKPLVVRPRGDRFEVIAGHRRFLACTMVQYSPVPCRVKTNDQVSALSILVHENATHEKVNAIEEARFYERVLMELCDEDVDQLVSTVKRNRGFLEDRLNLLRGHPAVIEALQGGQIPIAVARQLNMERDENRLRVFLDAAIAQGATARQVEAWRRDANLMGPTTDVQTGCADASQNYPALPANPFMVCFFCGTAEYPSMMELMWLHKPCKGIVRKALNLPDDSGENKG